jgi:hypothetical protein
MKKWNMNILRRTLTRVRRHPNRKSYRPLVEWLETRLTPANIDVLSYHYDQFLSGQNLQETVLHPGPASDPTALNATNFGTLLSQPIDGQAYAQPLYKTNVLINGVAHNVAFIATEHDSVYAFDADTGAKLWQHSFISDHPADAIGPTTAGITTTPYAELSTPDLFPEIGITGTGVIDAGASTLYEVVKTREVRADGGVHYVQTLHALDLATGADKYITTGNGGYVIGDTHVASPGAIPVFANETTAIVVPGNGGESSGGANPLVPFSAEKESDRMSLQLVGNIVYVAFASHADFRPYHGWVIGFDKTALQPIKVFNTAPNADGVAIWESGGGLSFDAQGFMYFAVGNGFQLTGGFLPFDPAHGNYSESVLKIDTTPNWSPADPQMMTVADYFTPFNWQTLDNQDADLGSGGVMLLPDSVGSDAHRHLLIETGKQGHIYLIDRDNMGKINNPGTGPDLVVQTVTAGQAGVWGNPAFFQTGPTSGIIYYHGSNDVLKGYRITNGHMDDAPADILKSTFNSIFPGTQPTVSADGTTDPLNPVNGIVWELQVDNAIGRIQGASDNTTAGPATLRAFIANPTGTSTFTELYDSGQTGQRDFMTGSVKFTVPVVTNGHVLVAGADHFSVLGLFPTETAAPAAPSNLAAQVQFTSAGPRITLTWTNPGPNPGHDPTGIKIFRSTDGTTFTPINTVNRNLNTFIDTGPFVIGQQYFYQVVAANQVGDSPPSNTVSATVPIPPPALTVTGTGASAVGLSWTGLANDHFTIERSANGGAFTPVITVPSSQTDYTDTGLAPGQYAYRIRAVNVNPNAEALSNVQGTWVGSMIDHSGGFSTTSDLTANGSAFFTTNLLELTNAPGQAGSAFSNTRFTVANFTNTFRVRLHEGTQPAYADGFTFILQANGPTALGSAAAGIGYQGIDHSVAVVFSTFQHAGDPSTTSVGLALNGAAPVNPIDTTPGGLLLNSQDPKDIQLSYDGTALTVRIQDIDQPQLIFTASFMVNIPQVIGSDTAYVGFTGGSGSGTPPAWELEDVLSWKFTSQAPVPGAPSNLRVVASTSSEIDLIWNGNSYNETAFQVERSLDGTTFTVLATTTALSFQDVGLPSGTYFYRVKALRGGTSDSPYSNVLSFGLAGSLPGAILTQHQDVGTAGNPSVAGNATFSNGVYTVTGSGSDIWDTADHMHYLYRPFTGDGQIIARILTETSGVNDFAKAGVMFRDGLDAGAENAYMMQFPNPGSRPGWPTYQWRANTNGSTADHEFQTLQVMPLWVRLVRSGNTFIGYWAVDMSGTPGPWNQLGAETVAMGVTVYVGLAVTSHSNGAVVTATFDHVQIMPAVEQISHFDVSASASVVNPGTPVTITVKALDQFNNIVTSYRGTVHFASTDPTISLPPDHMFTAADNGVYAFTVTLPTVGNPIIKATDTVFSTVSGATAVTVTTSTLIGSLLVAGFPSPVHAGVAGTLTVTAKDANGNPATGYRGTVHFVSSDPTAVFINPATGQPLPGNNYTFTAFDNGVHTFTVILNTAGTQSITATDLTANVSGTQSNIVVTAPVSITSLAHSTFAINEGGQFTLNGSLSDPITGPGHTATITWGDGTPDTTLSLVGGLFTFSANHQYLEEGDYALRVTVKAADGSSDTVTLPVTPAGLVSWWSAEGSSATAADVTGSNPGTLNGGVTFVPGKTGKAFSFDGNPNRGSYVSVPDAANLDSTTGTWSFWLKTTQTSSFVGLVGKSDSFGSLNGITMQMDGGFARVEVKGNDFPLTLLLNPMTVRLNDGQWHQMTLTFASGGPVVLYIDGQMAASGTAPNFSFGANDPLRFGAMTDNFWAPYNGLLDEVQVYNRALSVAEVRFLSNAAPVVPPANLVDWWTGDGNNRTTAPDLAGMNPGTLNGGVTYAPGEVGNAFTFDGNRGSYVNVPDVPNSSLNSTTGTWDFWFKSTQTNAYVGLVGKSDSSGSVNGITMQIGPDGHARIEVKGPGPTLLLNGSTLVNDGQWHHMALTFQSGGTAIMYVDGQMQDSGTAPTFSFGANDPLRFGTMTDGFWTPLNGQLDEVQIFNRVLSATEVQSIYNAGSAGLVKGVHVSDVAVIPIGGFTAIAYASVASSMQTVSVFTDPAGPEALADYSATINWGDNTTPSAGVISFNAGTGVFTVQGSHSYTRTGLYTITVTLHHDTAPDATATSTALVFAPVLRLTGFPSPIVAGTSGSFTVTVQDLFGSMLSGYRGTLHFTSSDPQADLPADYMFNAADAGTHMFSATLKTAGTQSLTATDTMTASATGIQSGIIVNPAAASSFMVAGFPSPTTAGAVGAVIVTAKDPYGNVATGYQGTVHLTSTDPQAQLEGDHTFTAADAGRYAFGAVLKTAGTQSITATDTTTANITGTQSGIIVTPAAVSTLVVAGYPSPTQRREFHNFTVTATDSFGNLITGYRGTVTFSSDESHADLPDDYTFTAADMGMHTFSAAFNRFGTFSLTATDTSDPRITGTQSGIEVVNGGGGGGGGGGAGGSGGDGGGQGASFRSPPLTPVIISTPVSPSQLATSGTTGAWVRSRAVPVSSDKIGRLIPAIFVNATGRPIGNAASGGFLSGGVFGEATGRTVVFTNTGTFHLETSFADSSDSTGTGGTYMVTATLPFNRANVVTNATAAALDGPAAPMANPSDSSALTSLAVSAGGGNFTIQNSRSFTTVAAFSNEEDLIRDLKTEFCDAGPWSLS